MITVSVTRDSRLPFFLSRVDTGVVFIVTAPFSLAWLATLLCIQGSRDDPRLLRRGASAVVLAGIRRMKFGCVLILSRHACRLLPDLVSSALVSRDGCCFGTAGFPIEFLCYSPSDQALPYCCSKGAALQAHSGAAFYIPETLSAPFSHARGACAASRACVPSSSVAAYRMFSTACMMSHRSLTPSR